MCVTVCSPCKCSQIACSVSTCVPDIVAQCWLRMAGDFLSIKYLPLSFLVPFSCFSPHIYISSGNNVSYTFSFSPPKACLHSEGHMDDGLTLQRCQHEESRAARIIRNTTLLFNRFIRYAKHCSTTPLCLTNADSDVIAQIAQLSQITVHIRLEPLYEGNLQKPCHWYTLHKYHSDDDRA